MILKPLQHECGGLVSEIRMHNKSGETTKYDDTVTVVIVVEATPYSKAESHLFLVAGTLYGKPQSIFGDDTKGTIVTTVNLFNRELKQILGVESRHVLIHPRKAVTFPNDDKYGAIVTSGDFSLRLDVNGYTLSRKGSGDIGRFKQVK